MSTLENEIRSMLINQGVNFVHFIDISNLSLKQNRGLPNAILFGIGLTTSYLNEVSKTTNYVQTMIEQGGVTNDELNLAELKTDRLANETAEFLISNKYNAFSQSDDNLIASGVFDGKFGKTPLPHKIIALLAGIGWIGKNNLLITPEYGAALCLGTVLTDAPLHVSRTPIIRSKCGECQQCLAVCKTKALLGTPWEEQTSREKMIDVYKCTTCMECMTYCIHTQKYMKSTIR